LDLLPKIHDPILIFSFFFPKPKCSARFTKVHRNASFRSRSRQKKSLACRNHLQFRHARHLPVSSVAWWACHTRDPPTASRVQCWECPKWCHFDPEEDKTNSARLPRPLSASLRAFPRPPPAASNQVAYTLVNLIFPFVRDPPHLFSWLYGRTL